MYGESNGLKIGCFIVLTLVAAAIIAYLIYFNEMRTGSRLTTVEINYIMIASFVLLLIVLGVWAWVGVRLFFSRSPEPRTITYYHPEHYHHGHIPEHHHIAHHPEYHREYHHPEHHHPEYHREYHHPEHHPEHHHPEYHPEHYQAVQVSTTPTGIPGDPTQINEILRSSGDS